MQDVGAIVVGGPMAQNNVRGRLLFHDTLMRTRTRYISVILALPRQQGYGVPTGSAEAFPMRVRALALPGPCSR